MRIRTVEITNFRCIGSITVSFDEVTSFIGPNGAGKSTILRALDWFFNGGTLTDSDVYSDAQGDDRYIQVAVHFSDLTTVDRDALGAKYCPPDVDTFTAWRTWVDGVDKFTGKAKAYLPFEEIRSASNAAERKMLLNAASEKSPELSIPRWTNQASSLAAMDEWERANPDHLTEAEVSDTHFFGFRGDRKLSGIFDYVLVAADLRATEESADSRSAIVGRLLDLVVDRSSANEATELLIAELSARQEQINADHLDGQLAETADTISQELDHFSAGRSIRLVADSSLPKVHSPRIHVTVLDGQVETSVERQGHGLQRTLLISTLRLLASKGAANTALSTVVLAIEEPELFQHPTQAKLLANVLRKIASGPKSGVQVAYATHSPYFIEPHFFDQVRRVTRRQRSGESAPTVEIHQASMESVAARLEGHTARSALISRWQQVCLNNLAEAFFANMVTLVEGDHDRAILDGIARRTRPFEADGIVVSTANGKLGIQVPHSILTELGIPVFCIFDNDSGQGDRMRRDGKDPGDIEQQELSMKRENRKMLRYFDLPETDSPSGILSATVGVTPDIIETELDSNWPAWRKMRTTLIEQGRGAGGKNAATYALAATECDEEPEGTLLQFVGAIRKLAASPSA